jgi:hypothetical protein
MAEANFIIRARDRSRDAIASADARLAKLQGRMRSFGGLGLGRALGAGALVAYGKAALSTADNIDNMSQRMKLGHESVQSINVLMKEAGMSGEMFGSVMDKLVQTMDAAKTGNQKAVDSFAALGINLADLKKMTPEQALEAVSKALHRNQGDARTSAAATDVLGARSTKLQHVLNQLGAQGFGALNADMLRTKRIMEQDMIKAGDKMEQDLSRALDRMSVRGKTFAIEFMGGLRAVGLRAMGKSWDEIGEDLFGSPEMPQIELAPPPVEAIEEPIIAAAEQAAEIIKQSMDQFSSADLVNRAQSKNMDKADAQRAELIKYQAQSTEYLRSLSLSLYLVGP